MFASTSLCCDRQIGTNNYLPPYPVLYKFSFTTREAECTTMTLGFDLGYLSSFEQWDISGDNISSLKRSFLRMDTKGEREYELGDWD